MTPGEWIEYSKRIIYKSGYKYQLVESCLYQTKIHPRNDIDVPYISLRKDGLLFVKAAYAWDGPSGITIDTKSFMRGSLIHDALYQLIRMGYLELTDRAQADKELYTICLEDGMCKIRAWYVYQCVKQFAQFAALPKNKKRLQDAP